jgi:hypothetical protein
MNDSIQDISASLRAEADLILHEKGLLGMLRKYGLSHMHGSYALDLMTWRDLDIYLESQGLSEERFFELGGRIAAEITPTKMSFRNERIAQTAGLPHGLYWGIYFNLPDDPRWEIDIWCVESEECSRLLSRERCVAGKLTAANRQIILSIKSECWNHSEYRRGFSSDDFYTSVLDEHVSTFTQFREYLLARKGISV